MAFAQVTGRPSPLTRVRMLPTGCRIITDNCEGCVNFNFLNEFFLSPNKQKNALLEHKLWYNIGINRRKPPRAGRRPLRGGQNEEKGVWSTMQDVTRKFAALDSKAEMKEILSSVYNSLMVKGYNPINQIVGYILSEDPTYITSYNNARSLICRLDRDELLQELLKTYLDK